MIILSFQTNSLAWSNMISVLNYQFLNLQTIFYFSLDYLV